MEKLRIEKDLYTIEVNDKGEYIEFDQRDISLGSRLVNGFETLEKQTKEYEKAKDKLLKEINNETEQIKEFLKLDLEFYKKMRSTYDYMLGEGACQKIFGDSNFYGMFEELAKQLKPHFDKMKINITKKRENLVAKYKTKKDDVI